MVRKTWVDENGLKKGLWSKEEDDKLRAYVMRHTHFNWRQVPNHAGLSRCGKSCRLRWINYLRPDVKHGNFSKEEDDIIVRLHQQLGNRWSKIATELSGRTDNEVKNRWHTHLKKRVQKTEIPLTTSITTNKTHEITTKHSQTPTFCPIVLESSPLISNKPSDSPIEADKAQLSHSSAEDFWTPFLTDDYTCTQHDYISSYSSYYGDTADLIDQMLH